MAACCGESTTKDGNDEPDADVGEKVKEIPANSLPLERIHAILDRMSEANSDAPRKGTTGKSKSTDGNKDEDHNRSDGNTDYNNL